MTPRAVVIRIGLVAILGACAVSDDPADGGFVSGITGISSGTYDARIAERSAAVDSEQRRQAALRAELSELESEYATLQREIIAQRSKAAADGKSIPASLDAEVRATLTASPGGATDAARLENYRRAVSDARRLSNLLANI